MSNKMKAGDINLDFLAESQPPGSLAVPPKEPFLVLIVDDEEEVHKVTRMTLRGMVMDGHGLVFQSVYNARDAQSFLAAHPKVAVMLLDVVMESDEAGFEVVQYLRGTLNNHQTRIILRTGQPGLAPEESVIARFDINDYKSKTELTSQKLFTAMYSCLRSYQDIQRIEENRNGLRKIIDSTSLLFRFRNISLRDFLDGILRQLVALNHTRDAMIIINKTIIGDRLVENSLGDGQHIVLAGTGKYAALVDKPLRDLDIGNEFGDIFKRDMDEGTTVVTRGGQFVGYHKRAGSVESFIILVNSDEGNSDLVEIFITNLTIALDNYLLNQDTEQVQREIIARLSEIVEQRDSGMANHALRVSEISGFLGGICGLSADVIEKLKIASMMHDIGKIGILDVITLKPERLSREEFATMQTHTSIGQRLLGDSQLGIVQMAASIAESHHECWDGSGYPKGLKGEDIPFLSRIVAIVDVFDALTHRRIYKDAWPVDTAFEYIKAQSGVMFDPKLTELFLEHRAKIEGIIVQYDAETHE